MSAKGRAVEPCNVLFLCTGNAARSIIAEAILNRLGAPRFRAYSAGSHPKGEVNAHAVALLQRHGFETKGLRPKSWSEFAWAGAPRLDLVVTVCDNVAAETCPVWRGRPVAAHWSVPDPSAVQGPEIARVVAEAYDLLQARIAALCALPLASLDRRALQRALGEIGRLQDHSNQ